MDSNGILEVFWGESSGMLRERTLEGFDSKGMLRGFRWDSKGILKGF